MANRIARPTNELSGKNATPFPNLLTTIVPNPAFTSLEIASPNRSAGGIMLTEFYSTDLPACQLTSCADSQQFERTDRRDWCSEVDRLGKC